MSKARVQAWFRTAFQIDEGKNEDEEDDEEGESKVTLTPSLGTPAKSCTPTKSTKVFYTVTEEQRREVI